MSNILNALGEIRPVMHPTGLDLSELLGPEYASKDGTAMVLPFRVNWSRATKKARSELSSTTYLLQQRALLAVKIEEINAKLSSGKSKKKASLQNERNDIKARLKEVGGPPREGEALANSAAWYSWWADVLVMDAEDVEQLHEAIPDPHWRAIQNQILLLQEEWEAEETKKSYGSQEPTSETQNETTPQQPGNEQ